MAKSSSSSWSWKSWTITTTRNSDGSVTYSANGNSVTVSNNWSYSYSSASWKTWGWTVKWWSSAASSFNSTYWGWSSITSNGSWWFTVNNSSSSNWSWSWSNNNPWYTPVSQVEFGWLQFWQWTSDADQSSRNDMLARYYAGKDNVTADSIMADLSWWNAWFAGASSADQQNTVNKILTLANQYKNWWWTSWTVNWTEDWNQYPQYPEKNYPDYNSQFDSIKNYINNLSWDLSWMKDLMEKNNSMFLSKLDAQMTQQKAMEEKFNAEWARIEWQMDENTKAQKARLDQMEQTYNENLQKMQDMLTDYYTGTMDALEAKAAWESAAAASDLSAKWLNSAVVANTTAWLDKNYREQFNALMKNNIELWQQINNDYADFMNQLVNQHNTLDQNQIETLKYWLEQKQKYRQQETDLVNDYINNVYKPMEDHISKLAWTYTEKADAAYGKERAVAEYKWMSTDWRTKAIMDRLIAMVWDGNLEMLSEQDLNLVKQIASRTDIWSTEEAIAVLLKAAKQSWNSDIIDAVNSSIQNWTWNTNPGGLNNNWWWGGDWNNEDIVWEWTEWEWTEWEWTEWTTNWTSTKKEYSVILLNKDWTTSISSKLNDIKNAWDSFKWKANEAKYLLEMIDKDYAEIKRYRDKQAQWSSKRNQANALLNIYERDRKQVEKYYGEAKQQANMLLSSSAWEYSKKFENIVSKDYKTNQAKIDDLKSLKNKIQKDLNKNPEYTSYGDLINKIDAMIKEIWNTTL